MDKVKCCEKCGSWRLEEVYLIPVLARQDEDGEWEDISTGVGAGDDRSFSCLQCGHTWRGGPNGPDHSNSLD